MSQATLFPPPSTVTYDEFPLKAWPGGAPKDPWRWTCPEGHTGSHATHRERDDAVHRHVIACTARPVSMHTWQP